MELFLFSNFAITLVAVLYNRYSQASILAKLIISWFALLSWLVPFTLIRDFLPQEVVVNVTWFIADISSSASQDTLDIIQPTVQTLSPLDISISLTQVFCFLCSIGFIIFAYRLFQQKQWTIQVENHNQTKLISHHKGIPVFSSVLIKNAVLSGYRNPIILVNPKLVNSKYLDIVLEHEITHFTHRDNYWLALIEFTTAIYWWNPLLRLLLTDIKDYLEARCDHKTSQSFTEGIYVQKLTDLILTNMPVSNTGFASAVISKNSNIRRLKTLKENQTMNLLSKLSISLLLVTGMTLLLFHFQRSMRLLRILL